MLTVGSQNAQTREKWIKETLLKIPNDSLILDAGAGTRPFKSFCNHLKYISQDFGQYDGKGEIGLHTGDWDNTGLDIVSDIIHIPLADDSVDAIMCTEVFEHIPDPIRAIREFTRLIKPGGYLLITVPFCSLTHFAPYHYYTGFNKFFFEKYLPENDFEILDFQYNGNYFEFLGQEIRRVNSVARKYSNLRLNVIERVIMKTTLWTLQRLSRKGQNSSELLNFGLHIFARKSGSIHSTLS